MNRRNNNRGFTLMETLIAVAILVILMSLAFVGVINYRRSMKQLELDKTAREIFVAAQNHLTMAESLGTLESRDKSDASVVGGSADHVNEDGKATTYHYFCVAPDVVPQRGTVLYDMLPQYSLDETVRTSGSYVIEYCMDGDEATVTNVFYSDQSDLSEVTFGDGDYATLMGIGEGADPGYWGADAADRRRDGYKNESNGIIGWYGGDETASLTRVKLFAPRVELKNEERLWVKISFSTTALNKMVKSGAEPIIQVFVVGETSGNTRPVNFAATERGKTLADFISGSQTEVLGTSSRRYKYYSIDDITTSGGHFYDLFCTGTDALIPGENIKIQVKVFSDTKLANVVQEESNKENSLFSKVASEEVTSGATTETVRVAEIANIRHLENLDAQISGYAKAYATIKSNDLDISRAQQTAELTWKGTDSNNSDGFLNKISAGDKLLGLAQRDVSAVKVFGADGSMETKEGTYKSVEPVVGSTWYVQEYDGGGYSVKNLSIDATGNNGMFSEVHDMSIHDLNIVSPDVRSTGDAGALAGKIIGCTVTNVKAYNDPTRSDEASLEIRGASSTGGLVGSATDKANTIVGSAAALYVNSTGGNAGGLVGFSDAPLTIDGCYVGGHTVDGAFLTTVNGDAAGRMNIMGQTNVGGIVGDATQMTGDGVKLVLKNSYSTASVYARSNTAGGLVGAMYDGSFENCYAANLVVDRRSEEDETIHGGGFIGSAGGTQTYVGNCQYLATVNPDAYAMGNGNTDDVTGITLADADLDAYRAFSSGRQLAAPYDDTLTRNYNGIYPFKTVEELANPSLEQDSTITRYGDWPSPETMVVNTPTS